MLSKICYTLILSNVVWKLDIIRGVLWISQLINGRLWLLLSLRWPDGGHPMVVATNRKQLPRRASGIEISDSKSTD